MGRCSRSMMPVSPAPAPYVVLERAQEPAVPVQQHLLVVGLARRHQVDRAVVGIGQAHGRAQRDLQHPVARRRRRHLHRGLVDDAGGVGAARHLVEELRVVEGHGELVGNDLQHGHVVGWEGGGLVALQVQHAQHVAAELERYGQLGAGLGEEQEVARVRGHVVHGDAGAIGGRPADDAGAHGLGLAAARRRLEAGDQGPLHQNAGLVIQCHDAGDRVAEPFVEGPRGAVQHDVQVQRRGHLPAQGADRLQQPAPAALPGVGPGVADGDGDLLGEGLEQLHAGGADLARLGPGHPQDPDDLLGVALSGRQSAAPAPDVEQPRVHVGALPQVGEDRLLARGRHPRRDAVGPHDPLQRNGRHGACRHAQLRLAAGVQQDDARRAAARGLDGGARHRLQRLLQIQVGAHLGAGLVQPVDLQQPPLEVILLPLLLRHIAGHAPQAHHPAVLAKGPELGLHGQGLAVLGDPGYLHRPGELAFGEDALGGLGGDGNATGRKHRAGIAADQLGDRVSGDRLQAGAGEGEAALPVGGKDQIAAALQHLPVAPRRVGEVGGPPPHGRGQRDAAAGGHEGQHAKAAHGGQDLPDPGVVQGRLRRGAVVAQHPQLRQAPPGPRSAARPGPPEPRSPSGGAPGCRPSAGRPRGRTGRGSPRLR